MADWTNSSGLYPTAEGRHVWGPPQIRYFQESSGISSAQCQPGHVVRRDTVVTTGGLRVRRDPSTAGNGGNLLHIGGAEIIGICVVGSTAPSTGGTLGLLDDSSQAQGRLGDRTIGVAIADGLTEYLGYFKAGATAGPGAFSSIVGNDMPLIFDSTLGTYFIASTNSTAALAHVRITGFPTNAAGDSGGVPAYFKFLSSNVHPAVRLTGPTV